MNVLSLFSGIGGLDLGLERAGMTICGQVEIDPWCRKVLAKHWPEVPRHDDVRTCADWWLGTENVADAAGVRRDRRRDIGTDRAPPCRSGQERQSAPHSQGGDMAAPAQTAGGRPRVDLVCGGFPCQPVSLAGKGLAQADSRWLWPAFADVIRHLRPRFVLVENVPGLLGRGMGDVLGDLACLGYDAEWDCVPAAFVGAPHIRNRVWIVAYPRNGIEPERARETRRQAGQRSPVRHVAGNAGQDVADADSGGTRADAGRGGAAAPARPGDGPQRWRGTRPDIGSGSPDVANTTVAERRATQPQGVAPAGWRTPEPRERDSSGRPIGDWWAVEPGVGRVAHGIPHRVDRLRGLGNAVVPQVAEHIGRLILGAAA